MQKLKIVFFGSPDFIKPIIESLRSNFNLIKVINSQTPESEIKSLKELNPDLFVVAAYGKIITLDILSIPKFGSLNIHPSLLPKYRGACPIQSAILNGDKITGISIIKMDQQVDHGSIIYQTEYVISSDDTLESLSKKLFLKAAQTLPRIIVEFTRGKIVPIPQDDDKAIYTWKTAETKECAKIDLTNLPPSVILNQKIRAFYPEPGAWTTWRGKHIKLLPKGLIQMEGKQAVELKDFLNGYPDFPIKQLFEA